MAELIERELLCHSLAQHLVQGLHGQNVDLEEATKGHHAPSYRMGFEYGIQLAQTIVCNRPTTTEAEIRAKALGVMGMAMKEYYPSCKGAYVDFDVFFHAVMAKVAEQLKERD